MAISPRLSGTDCSADDDGSAPPCQSESVALLALLLPQPLLSSGATGAVPWECWLCCSIGADGGGAAPLGLREGVRTFRREMS